MGQSARGDNCDASWALGLLAVYDLTGAVFARDSKALSQAQDLLRYSAGNLKESPPSDWRYPFMDSEARY